MKQLKKIHHQAALFPVTHNLLRSIVDAAAGAGLSASVANGVTEDGLTTIEYMIRHHGEERVIFSGTIKGHEDPNYTKLIDILRGRMVSEIFPPAEKDYWVTKESDPVRVNYWRHVMITETDISKPEDSRQIRPGQNHSVWIAYDHKSNEICRVADGSENTRYDQVDRVLYLDLGVNYSVVAVVFKDDPIVEGQVPTLGQMVAKTEEEAAAAAQVKKDEVYLPPLLKASEYDTLDPVAKKDYNFSITKVAMSIIQDIHGVIRSGNPAHLDYLRSVLKNGHMVNELAGINEQSEHYGLSLRAYMVEELQISAVLLQTLYPDENIDPVGRPQDAKIYLSEWHDDIENFHMHCGWVNNAVFQKGHFRGLSVEETYWLYSLLHETATNMGSVVESAGAQGYLALNDSNKKTFLHVLRVRAAKRDLNAQQIGRLIEAFLDRVMELQQKDFGATSVVMTSRDYKALDVNGQVKYGDYVKYHCLIAQQEFEKDTEMTRTGCPHSVAVIDQVVKSRALSGNASAKGMSAEELRKFTCEYFGIPSELAVYANYCTTRNKKAKVIRNKETGATLTVPAKKTLPVKAALKKPARAQLMMAISKAEFDKLKDFEKTQYRDKWMHFIGRNEKLILKPEGKGHESLIAVLRGFLTSGFMVERKKNDLSESAKMDSLEWYTAQRFGLDEAEFTAIMKDEAQELLKRNVSPGARKKADAASAEKRQPSTPPKTMRFRRQK